MEDAEDARRGRSLGARKDQSHVLFTLTQTELGRLRLPIGEYRKETVRWIAAEAGLPVAGKPDSHEICFTSGAATREPIEVPAEIRYKASEAPATVSPDGEWLRIDFHDPSAR